MVLDRNLKKLQQATGTMQFSRPGRFRWEYDKPYEQTIVGDGSRLWIYDKDLNQVTVRKLDRALGASPAALLAGSNEIEKTTRSTASATRTASTGSKPFRGRRTPRSSASGSASAAGLQAMELRDQFGQMTVIRFADLERNAKLAPEAFRFTPPKGADVISEP